MSLIIYHAPYSRSIRVLWLCEEMGLPYEKRTVPIHGRGTPTSDFLDASPQMKVPALRDGDVTMLESLAIMDYLLARHENLMRPAPTSSEYPAYLQYFHFGEASLAPPIITAMRHRVLKSAQTPSEEAAEEAHKATLKALQVLAAPLETQDYLLPSGFSAADISCGYMLLLAKLAKVFDGAPEPVVQWWERLTARREWQAATADIGTK